MIGKPSWFQRRKYGGWGIYPKTWQGWVYVAVMVGLIMVSQALPLSEKAGTITLFSLAAIFAFDVVHIMVRMPRDERERMHEAIAERNALWAMLAVMTVGVGYQAAVSVVNESFSVDPVILAALGAGLVAKAATNVYLDRKD